jgi:hypothetical protein
MGRYSVCVGKRRDVRQGRMETVAGKESEDGSYGSSLAVQLLVTYLVSANRASFRPGCLTIELTFLCTDPNASTHIVRSGVNPCPLPFCFPYLLFSSPWVIGLRSAKADSWSSSSFTLLCMTDQYHLSASSPGLTSFLSMPNHVQQS